MGGNRFNCTGRHLLYHFKDATFPSLATEMCKYVNVSCNSKDALRGAAGGGVQGLGTQGA